MSPELQPEEYPLKKQTTIHDKTKKYRKYASISFSIKTGNRYDDFRQFVRLVDGLDREFSHVFPFIKFRYCITVGSLDVFLDVLKEIGARAADVVPFASIGVVLWRIIDRLRNTEGVIIRDMDRRFRKRNFDKWISDNKIKINRITKTKTKKEYTDYEITTKVRNNHYEELVVRAKHNGDIEQKKSKKKKIKKQSKKKS